MSEPLEEFMLMARRAAEQLDATDSVAAMEPWLVQMLGVVKAHPELRRSFEAAFIDMCDSQVPKEIVQFCMRELQWPAVKSFVERKMWGTADDRALAVLQQVLDVYAHEWADADLFEYYSKGQSG